MSKVNWNDWVKFYDRQIKETEEKLLFYKQSYKAVKFLCDYNKRGKKKQEKK